MKKIPLTRGKFALIDDDDFERVNAFKWLAHFDGWNWYAEKTIRKNYKVTTMRMHSFILGVSRPDHIDGNGLNNQKCNLRPSTRSQNGANRKMMSNNKSGYRGVSWDKRDKRWKAYVTVSGKSVYAGEYTDKVSAAIARDEVAKKLFGEFARLNFPKAQVSK
jgi:hypothetical protein